MKILIKGSLVSLLCTIVCSQSMAENIIDKIDEMNQARVDRIVKKYSDTGDFSLKTYTFKYKSHPVTFSHQLWKIPNKSVCQDVEDVQDFAFCTQNAKKMFRELCTMYQSIKNSEFREQKQRMFCNAAAEFKPTYATIERAGSEGQRSGKQISEACKQAKLDAYMQPSSETAKRRDEVCR